MQLTEQKSLQKNKSDSFSEPGIQLPIALMNKQKSMLRQRINQAGASLI
jgi:hypothetical protein